MKITTAGELMMVGFDGYSLDPSVRKRILNWKVGGVILFGRNIQTPYQTAELCQTLQELRSQVSDLPLFIAVDQEGGAVARFRQGVTLFPGNMALGVGGTEEDAYQQGRITGKELRELGINMNLAPVLDLYSLPGNPSLGIRSLGSDPSRVAALGKALVKGMQEEGIVATAKHFPGKGNASVDSHDKLPLITDSASELKSRDLVPFSAAVASGVKAIMTSHAAYPAFEKDVIPATLSREIIRGLLRDELHFDNLVITDDLGMGAIRTNFRLEEAVTRALGSGVDMVLLCHSAVDQEKTFAFLREQISANNNLAPSAEESLKRIRKVKSTLPKEIPKIPPRPGGEDPLALEIARKAVTVIRDRPGILPLKKGERPVLIWVNPEQTVQVENEFDPQWKLGRYLEEEGLFPEVISISLSPSPEEIDSCLRRTRKKKFVIVTSYDAYRFSRQAVPISVLLKSHPAAVLVVLRDPQDELLFPEADTVILSFGFTPHSLKAVAEVISGKIKPRREVVGIAGLNIL